MIHHIYDHTFHPWFKRVKRINGAFTYSQDICRYYLPRLQNTLEIEKGFPIDSIVVSTCAPFHKYVPKDIVGVQTKRYDVFVQWLHTYPYVGYFEQVEKTWERMRNYFGEIIFVCAYRDFVDKINAWGEGKGVSARFVPMRIGHVPDVKKRKRKQGKAVWFGNVYAEKTKVLDSVAKVCKEQGVELDIVSNGRLNGGILIDQEQAWQLASDAGIVFAVGRCALEAYAMGCYVIIAGEKFGGTCITWDDWMLQESTNFNGRVWTGHDSFKSALVESMHSLERIKKRPTMGKGRILCRDLIRENGGLIW